MAAFFMFLLLVIGIILIILDIRNIRKWHKDKKVKSADDVQQFIDAFTKELKEEVKSDD